MARDAAITEHIFEHARDIILVICAKTGSFVDANRAAELAYGYSHAELLGMHIYDLRVDCPLEVEQQMQRASCDGILFEATHRRRDGSVFAVEVSSRGQEIGGRPLLFSVVRDISERKQLEGERDELLAATQRALALRDEFLMIASHELRTPVTNFILQLERLQRSLLRETSHAQNIEAAALSLRESRRLAALIDTLLDAQRGKGAITLKRCSFDLAELARDVIQRMDGFATRAGSTIESELQCVIGHWDRLRVDQVLTNVVHNAIKYGRGRPVRITVSKQASNAVIEVIDSGLGIAAESTHRVFEKFERAVPPSYGGLGLGLYIARQIVNAHDGNVEIISAAGQGTHVRVLLPVPAA
jgi:PAS domain S-box-containing protein